MIYGFTGFHMEKYAPGEAPPVDEAVILPPIEEAAVLQPAGEAMSETRAADATVWYQLTAERRPRSSASILSPGLDDAEVTRRREQYGPNRLAEPPKESTSEISTPVQGFMQIVLLVVAIISIVVLQDFATGIFIIGLTVLNAVLGLNQEGGKRPRA